MCVIIRLIFIFSICFLPNLIAQQKYDDPQRPEYKYLQFAREGMAYSITESHDKNKKTTDVVTVKKGVKIKVFLNLGETYKHLEFVTMVVTSPKVKTPKGEILKGHKSKERVESLDKLKVVFYGFDYEEDWELAAGFWHIKIYDKELLLADLQFEAKLP